MSKVLTAHDRFIATPIRQIAVALDGTRHGEAAVSIAAGLALSAGARVTLLTATHPPLARTGLERFMPFRRPERPPGVCVFDTPELASVYLRDRSELLARYGVETRFASLAGIPAQVIPEAASALEADYLITGARAGMALRPAFLGAPAASFLDKVAFPVVVTPAINGEPGPPRPAERLRSVIVALDGSSYAERALPHAERLARATRSSLVLFRASNAARLLRPINTGSPASLPNYAIEDAEREGKRNLAALADAARWRGLESVDTCFRSGNAGRLLAELAAGTPQSIVVLTIRAFSSVSRLVVGSTTAHVLRSGMRPVMIIPPPRLRHD